MPEAAHPAPDQPPKKRCTIYVDGFNWYFGVFQHRPAWKWFNVQSFFESLRLDENVVAIKFFTALIDPQKHVSNRRDRQKRYLRALGTLPKVKIILGKYQERTVTCQARDCMRRLEYRVPTTLFLRLRGEKIKAVMETPIFHLRKGGNDAA